MCVCGIALLLYCSVPMCMQLFLCSSHFSFWLAPSISFPFPFKFVMFKCFQLVTLQLCAQGCMWQWLIPMPCTENALNISSSSQMRVIQTYNMFMDLNNEPYSILDCILSLWCSQFVIAVCILMCMQVCARVCQVAGHIHRPLFFSPQTSNAQIGTF